MWRIGLTATAVVTILLRLSVLAHGVIPYGVMIPETSAALEQWASDSVTTSSREPSAPRNDMLLFVCVLNLQGNLAQQARLKRMVTQGMLSIARYYPGANVLIPFGEIGGKPNIELPPGVNIRVTEVKTSSFNAEGEYTSYGRMRAYAEVITAELRLSRPRGIIFYDSDMLFVGHHFRRIFFGKNAQDWSVGLSFRNMPKFPVNCGLMLASQNNLVQSLRFWNEVLGAYDNSLIFRGNVIQKSDLAGDQRATCKVIENLGKYYVYPREHMRKLKAMNDTSILLLPTRRWNWTPKPMCHTDNRCAIIHFKGNKKVHMTTVSRLLQKEKIGGARFFREVALLGRDPRGSRRALKRGCSD
jgi:hypothetical protein